MTACKSERSSCSFCLYEQEAQRGHILTDRGRSQLLRLEQMSLMLPNLLGPELVRWLVKILRKIADDANVGSCGTMGVITTNLSQPSTTADPRTRGSVSAAPAASYKSPFH